MGKFIEKREPSEASYLIELTQSEVDVVQGIVSDLLDNPSRKVAMDYSMDNSYVMPSEKGMEALKGAFNALKDIDESIDYDYFDYWNEVPRPVVE